MNSKPALRAVFIAVPATQTPPESNALPGWGILDKKVGIGHAGRSIGHHCGCEVHSCLERLTISDRGGQL
jgi:hypothetical protein